jgi:hypothetical protein
VDAGTTNPSLTTRATVATMARCSTAISSVSSCTAQAADAVNEEFSGRDEGSSTFKPDTVPPNATRTSRRAVLA